MNAPPIWHWNLKDHKKFDGVYSYCFHNIGRFRKTQFWFKRKKDNKTWAIWGTYAILQRLQFIKLGTRVKFNFTGKKKDKKHKFGIMTFKFNVGKGAEKSIGRNRSKK